MSLVVGTIEELECRLNAFGVALVGAPLGRQLIEALARAEKAETESDGWLKAAEAWEHQSGFNHIRAEQAERERDAMHAAAEELRAQDAVLPEAHSGRTSRRPYVTTHDDETLLEWWNGDRKLSVYIDDGGIRALKVGPGAEIVDVELALGGWAAARDWLNGTGRKTEESDGKQADEEASGGPVRGAEGVTEGTMRDVRTDEAADGALPERPPGIPASATIWAEVVDGLGRKVGAWFDAELRQVTMVTHRDSGRLWTPKLDHQWGQAWMGPEASRPAAVQCRQLYEKGLAHLAAKATPKPTLTPVDLTELREAWKEPGERTSENWDRFIAAVEKLLSSGGAP